MWKVPEIKRVLAVALILASAGCAGLDTRSIGDILGSVTGREAGLDEATVIAGLREALRVGTERTVGRTSRLDGFLANELIRIALPRELDKMAGALRKIGLDGPVDELETAINRAAEQASSEAVDVFVQAIGEMTIQDGFSILRGEDNAATEYFRGRTSDSLRERFHPIVTNKIEQVGLARMYERAVDRYAALPFVTRPAVDLDEYVTEQALDGLFTILADEELRIRKDPAARTTELLEKVFRRD